MELIIWMDGLVVFIIDWLVDLCMVWYDIRFNYCCTAYMCFCVMCDVLVVGYRYWLFACGWCSSPEFQMWTLWTSWFNLIASSRNGFAPPVVTAVRGQRHSKIDQPAPQMAHMQSSKWVVASIDRKWKSIPIKKSNNRPTTKNKQKTPQHRNTRPSNQIQKNTVCSLLVSLLY